MVVVIIKVHPLKYSRSRRGETYKQVDFYSKHHPNRMFHTFLSPQNHNYKNWKGLRVGDIISDVELAEGETDLIDADSKPKLVGHIEIKKQQELFENSGKTEQ